MKIVVIGGSGLIGSRVVAKLSALGHEAVAASPSSGVNTLTGEGIAEVLQGAQVVIDVANSPSFEDATALEFFSKSAHNLFPAEIAAGVKHHIALSVVGADVMTDMGYMRAKIAQEAAIQASGVPYTIVRATQFFEFMGQIAEGYTKDNVAHVPSVLMQPIAADDVAAALAQVALEEPINRTVELAGPESLRMDELVRQFLAARKDPREVVSDPGGSYFGAVVTDQTLRPGISPLLGTAHFGDWILSE
ncbi:SDR family oxidoreductase [Terriglobus saanensis]|uniref:NAD-dependent epimerase/dehydratase n=1 Tax=Terriglobus saanensis (strain ATCC BAA-1853 / DSM 23119 / SP1PR4) TaxID=401053 RepID=E8V832_TERSS|nr:SDR family oxidoreductase [Terriglobus saanensis]ADV84014.1 NAD-dependent epimerase/dehydratase [Terriglobus saanensis SP1PR4]